MSVRFGLGLIGIIIVAIIVGVAAGKSQPPTAAAPAATPTPTPIPAPPTGTIAIVATGSNSPEAEFVGSNMQSTYVARVGTKVMWINNDTQTHAVTADDGSFGSAPLATHQTFSWTPRKAGTYPYGDYLHPDVRGVIVVRS